jgi:hypothetical protein
MKYSEFIQLKELLENKNIFIKDIKENPKILSQNKLNEVSLPAILGGGALLATLGVLFGKNLVRLGIKGIYLKKLKNASLNFKKTILLKVEEIAKKNVSLRQSVYQKKTELQNSKNRGQNIQAEYKLLSQRAKKIDATLTKEVNEFITKLSDTKTKEVYSKIDELKILKDNQKIALKGYWDTLLPDIRIDAFKKLIDNGTLSDKDIVESLNKSFKQTKLEEKIKMKKIQDELLKDKKQKTKNEPSEETPAEKKPAEEKTVEEKPVEKPKSGSSLKSDDEL